MSEELLHYGIKGMKWGVRRGSNRKLSPEEGQRVLKSLEKKMSNTKDRKELKSLQKQYGKIEDSINYSNKKPNRLSQEIKSFKRKMDLRKQTKNSNSLTTKEIQKLAERVNMENDMKNLSKKVRVGKNFIDAFKNQRANKQDYRLRGDLSDKELSDKVQRLRALDKLSTQSAKSYERELQMGKKFMKYLMEQSNDV